VGTSYNPVLSHQIENKGCLLAEIKLDFLFTGGRSVHWAMCAGRALQCNNNSTVDKQTNRLNNKQSISAAAHCTVRKGGI
jgi:hypothetical protein